MSKVLGNYLPSEVVDMLNQGRTTAVLSSLTEQGNPHAMPVHLMAAPNERTIFAALLRNHQTVKNIIVNGRAFLTLMEGSDMAYGIQCGASLIRDPMKASKAMCMLKLEVKEVKSDTTPTVIVVEGIKIKHRSLKTTEFLEAIFDELRNS
ncbi:pyridoxamine 5'-phosphate oxidase family protein [Candidatus Contubernalis alkaliaceticus]|uniref:pyridoxamine 5'-phosphate oxidase family protein n=1 Tax=Candidatus Contubernalis alkaliaceticus TaxID=338645 RepID=UPI001F4BFEBA|nr:pyridoxamine 5'-phosphate oxidase family protein [Candidatus Contubernalis alkalaceticus]UNC92916.1 pyridoxamine 5'-phosphate oxidase family protein [Candidatus Contubernalis alkalaceticus]